MKFILIFLLFLIPTNQLQVYTPFSFTIKNDRDCPYKVTLRGYNNQIYKIVYINAKSKITVAGDVPYPYFKIKFEKNKKVSCGCDNLPQVSKKNMVIPVWRDGDNFEVFFDITHNFVITKQNCSRV